MSDDAQRSRGISQLDGAHGQRLEGQSEGALRVACSLLTASEGDLGAAALIARLLLDAERIEVAGSAAERLVDAHVRRGDLASAFWAAHLGLEAGGFAGHALQDIAAAFGADSPRLGDGAALPPPLPAEVEIAPFFADKSGAELLDAAEKVLVRFAKSKDPVPADGPLPRLPLFGAMSTEMLGRLLGALETRELKTGEYAITRGEEGQCAFVTVRGVLNVVREQDDGATVLAVLGPGSIFGEMALVSSAPRAASVVAVEPTQLLRISRTQLEALAATDPIIGQELGAFCHRRMLSNLIRHSAILSEVEPGSREGLMARFETRNFAPRDLLVTQGAEAPGLFLLASGAVEVRSTDPEGDRVRVATLGPGDVVGEISLVLRKEATADVVATHPTVALELSREQFHEAIREHPTLLRELYELAVQRDDETRSVVAQAALDVSDVVLV